MAGTALLSLVALLALAGCGDGGAPPPTASDQPAATHASTPAAFAPALLGTPVRQAPASAPDPLKILGTSGSTLYGLQLSSFSVVPDRVTIPLGHTVFLNAVGILPDGSKITRTSVSRWIVQGDPIGRVSPIGALQAVAPGVAVVTAEDHVSGMSAYTIVTVPPGR